MTLHSRILGHPGRDNALLVTVDTGQSFYRLLFDCGEGCLEGVAVAEIKAIDALFFSHLHIDHVAGFDSFFRHNFNREDTPVRIFGPAGSAAILQHKFQGFMWNLVSGMNGKVQVAESDGAMLKAWQFLTREAFAMAHEVAVSACPDVIFERPEFKVEPMILHHGTPSVAYLVRENPRLNVDPDSMARLGLKPGPWLKKVKEPGQSGVESIEVDGRRHRLTDLQDQLLIRRPGESIAYLTDFLLDSQTEHELVSML